MDRRLIKKRSNSEDDEDDPSQEMDRPQDDSGSGDDAWNRPRPRASTAAGDAAAARASSSRRNAAFGYARASRNGTNDEAAGKPDPDSKARASVKSECPLKPRRSGKKRRSNESKKDGDTGGRKRRAKQDRGKDPQGDEAVTELQAEMLERIQQCLAESNKEDAPIDHNLALYLLEASSGNVELAAALYMDDFLCEEEGRRHAALPPELGGETFERRHSAARRSRSPQMEPQQRPSARHPRRPDGDDRTERRARGRVDNHFDDMEEDPPAPGGQNEEAVAQAVDGGEDIPPAEADAEAVAPDEEPAENNAESVSVSDDETAAAVAGGWKMVGSLAARLDGDDEEEVEGTNRRDPDRRRRSRRAARVRVPRRPFEANRRQVSEHVVDEEGDGPDNASEKEAKEEKKSAKASNSDDTDYLSDEILLEDEASWAHQYPVELLWGSRNPGSSADNETDGESGGSNNENNLIAEEDSSAAPSRSSIGIPRTWLNAGFSMSTCGTGLVTKPPPEEEVALLRWRNQQSQRGGGSYRNTALPPYHCRGITAILSAVTALLYTGASIQGTEVNCTSARKPFAELTEKERLQEFDSRLTDALSALLFIAAKAAIGRKRRFLEKRSKAVGEDGGDEDVMRVQTLRRRLRLCPTCRWEEDGTGAARLPEGPDVGKHVRVATSSTSIEDLRSYVISNMRSFTGRGGCALFLETIIRIHGKKCVARMVRRACQYSAVPGAGDASVSPLVTCTCEERQKRQSQKSPTNNADDTNGNDLYGHRCMSTELLSLVLTGQVRTSFKEWSIGGLGLGLLSNEPGEVEVALTRPERPVWIVRGDTCYSVLWLDGSKENAVEISQLDRPGLVFHLTHWNCWYGERNRTGMRVITAPGDWVPPTTSKESFVNPSAKRSVTESIVERRRKHCASLVSPEEVDGMESSERESAITSSQDLDRVTVHPDDQNYYPDEYLRWRYDLGTSSATGDGGREDGEEKKGRQENWIPYYRLNSSQRLLVDMKLAPKINRIIWTRWPKATVDKFTPVDESPPAV